MRPGRKTLWDGLPSPSGYRVTPRARFELGMAQQFTGAGSLQAVIDAAVAEYLMKMRSKQGFEDALRSAERELARKQRAKTSRAARSRSK